MNHTPILTSSLLSGGRNGENSSPSRRILSNIAYKHRDCFITGSPKAKAKAIEAGMEGSSCFLINLMRLQNEN